MAVPTLADIVLAPERAAELPLEALPAILCQLGALQCVLTARLAQCQNEQALGPKEDDRLLSVPDVAKILDVPKSYAYELARRGVLPTVRLGKYVRVRSATLRTWLDLQEGLDRPLSTVLSSRGAARTRGPTGTSEARLDASRVRPAPRRSSDHRESVGAQPVRRARANFSPDSAPGQTGEDQASRQR
jgi:excisionase family DNA binding protein